MIIEQVVAATELSQDSILILKKVEASFCLSLKKSILPNLENKRAFWSLSR